MIVDKTGNIFTTQCQTIVNTVNCVGVMGAGIAFEFKLRYPEMFKEYVMLCEKKQIDIGILWLYKSDDKWVLNFPTKLHWKSPSKLVYLEKGLKEFVDTYKEKSISSIAFPLLGASNGGIPEYESIRIMKKHLDQCDIDVEIYHFDPDAEDDLYTTFKKIFLDLPDKELSSRSELSIGFVNKLKTALQNKNIHSMSGLLREKGIGEKTLEKAFHFAQANRDGESQLSLF